MSHYETPEQRQIRQLRNELQSLTRNRDLWAESTVILSQQIDAVRNQAAAENNRLATRLRDQEAALQAERRHSNEMVRQLDAQVRERERKQQERIAAMERNHAVRIQSMENAFRQENGQLRRDLSRTRNELLQEIVDVRRETVHAIESVRQENARAMEALDQRLTRDIRAVDARVTNLAESLAKEKEGKRELAVYWTQEAGRLLEQIQADFKPQLMDHRRVSRLSTDISNALNDIKNGVYESGISSGRNAFYDLLDMKEELAQRALEWNYFFNAVRTREADLLTALAEAENRTYTYTDENGTEYVFDSGIDYWTNGQLSVVNEHVRRLRTTLENVDEMTTEQLQSVETELQSLQEQLALVENASQSNVAMSISRYRTAVKIGEILGEQYHMIDSDGEYFGTENREEYHAVYENPNTGDRVALIITPVMDPKTGVVQNHIDLLVGNANNDPLDRARISRAVAQSLRNSGAVENCSFPCSDRFGNQTPEEAERAGDIAAVERGDQRVRVRVPNVNTGNQPVVQRK